MGVHSLSSNSRNVGPTTGGSADGDGDLFCMTVPHRPAKDLYPGPHPSGLVLVQTILMTGTVTVKTRTQNSAQRSPGPLIWSETAFWRTPNDECVTRIRASLERVGVCYPALSG